MCLMRVDREEWICNSTDRVASSKHGGPGVPSYVTAGITHQYLGFGTSCSW